MQPQDPSAPHLSADGFWWWDGSRWVPAAQPGYYPAPAPPFEWKPSPGLRPFLLVMLSLQALAAGLFTLAGVAAVAQGDNDSSSITLLVIVVTLLALAVASIIGVVMRTVWARWVALASGIAMSLTCLGALIGVPIIVAASRAPLRKPAGG